MPAEPPDDISGMPAEPPDDISGMPAEPPDDISGSKGWGPLPHPDAFGGNDVTSYPDDLELVFDVISRASNAQRQRANPTPADRMRVLRTRNYAQDIAFKRTLLRWALWVTSGQLILTNAGVCYYMLKVGAAIDAKLLISWMAMALLECIGIVVIIARYLFPVVGNQDSEGEA